MGKSSGKVKVQTSPLETSMADIAQRQQGRAEQMQTSWEDPIRGLVQPQIMQALGTNPFQTSLSAPERAVYEQQFNQAKTGLMNSAQRGGQMRQAMRGLERDRAGAVATASNDAKQRGISRALQFAGGAVPTAQGDLAASQGAMSGLGAANQSASQRALAQAQMNAQSSQGLGSGIGSLLGMGAKGLFGK